MADLPCLAILPTPFENGIDDASDSTKEAAPLALVDFRSALLEEWPTDAHVVQYVVTLPNRDTGDHDVVTFPRLNHGALPGLKAMGAEVLQTIIGIDIDTPNHGPLHADTVTFFEEDISKKLPLWPCLMNFAAYYTTRAGARFIYVLKEPLPVEDCELVTEALVACFIKVGLQADTNCLDWTRLFRLPRVMRDGTPQGRRPFDSVLINQETVLDPFELPQTWDPLPKKPRSPATARLNLDMPDDLVYPEFCLVLDEKGREKPSDWLKEAKRRLKGRNCFPCLFGDEVMALPGARMNTLQSFIGEACALLSYQPHTTPQHLYALFLPAILKLDPDNQTPDWRVPLWSAICKYWPREIMRHELEAQTKKQEEVAPWVSLLDSIRAWNKSEALLGTDQEAREFVKRRAILASGNHYFVLKQDGRYETTETSGHHLISKIRQLGMEHVISTATITDRGVQDKPIQGIINEYVATGFEVEGSVDPERDGIVYGKKLFKTLFTRSNLEPVFDERVDQWLRIFAGRQYQKLCEWIGLALAWDEGPICALSIKGPPGCGKKLLVQGLVECVSTRECSDVTEFGDFKSGILRSPFLVVNEGFPDPRMLKMSPADAFRQFVGGDPIRVAEKYKVPIWVRNPLRVLFTTNNDEIIRALAGGRDLTPFDRDAIKERLFHIDVAEEARKWLLDIGGIRYTKGWIEGDAGQASDSVVAKHFMYLYANRPEARGSRLLMEGSNNERLIKGMTLRSGAAPIVLQVLVQLIELFEIRKYAAVVEDGKIYVTENMVEEYFEVVLTNKKPPSSHTIKNVISAMRQPGTEPKQEVRGSLQGGKKLATWHQLNAKLILEEAIDRGLSCGKLQRIVDFLEGRVESWKAEPAVQGLLLRSLENRGAALLKNTPTNGVKKSGS